jgi:hypothetical protein
VRCGGGRSGVAARAGARKSIGPTCRRQTLAHKYEMKVDAYNFDPMMVKGD